MPKLRLLPPVVAAETPEDAAPILEYLMNRGGDIAIDTETTGLDVMRSKVLYWSMATESRRFFFHQRLLGFFDPLFQRTDLKWYLANAKYDMHILRNMGYGLSGTVWDIIDMDAMEDDTRPHGLKEQARNSYDVEWGEFKELFLDPYTVSEELGLDKVSFSRFKNFELGDKLVFVYEQRPDIVENYATCDAFFTFMRAKDLTRSLDSVQLESLMVPEMKTLLDYYKVIEVPTTRCLWRMERTGFLVDKDWVKQIDEPLRNGIATAEKALQKIIGYAFNPRANDTIADILYGKDNFGLKPLKFTKGGKTEPKPSVDEKTLEKLKFRFVNDQEAPPYRFIEAKLKLSKLDKLHGTYVKKIDSHLGPDGRIHSRLNQSGTRTSRLSSSNPNMQNVPVRNDPYQIRGCFVADPGYDLIDYDYPQIEFRIAAALSGEEDMMAAIRKGWDIHSANAANMYKTDPLVSYEAIMRAKELKDAKDPSFGASEKYLLKKRDGAKTSGLGALYGEGAAKMAIDLKCSKDEAQDLIDTFFNTNRDIHAHIQYMHWFGETNEFTYTMLGRIRRLHGINNRYNRGVAAKERRIAYNTIIQGSGAEMIKLAMLQIDNHEEFNDLGGQLVLTVHDELIAKAPKPHSKRCAEIMNECMSDPYNWGPIKIQYPVPVSPDGSIGARWSECK